MVSIQKREAGSGYTVCGCYLYNCGLIPEDMSAAAKADEHS